VISNSSLETISQTLKENCIVFEDHNDTVTKLKYLKENPDELYERRLKIYEYARNNMIWEKYEKAFLEPTIPSDSNNIIGSTCVKSTLNII
jgi:hypothetical protein